MICGVCVCVCDLHGNIVYGIFPGRRRNAKMQGQMLNIVEKTQHNNRNQNNTLV